MKQWWEDFMEFGKHNPIKFLCSLMVGMAIFDLILEPVLNSLFNV